MPLVSVCMPTYNRASYLKGAIEQILGQTFGDFELLVADDASTDNTREVLSRFRDRRMSFTSNTQNLNIPGNLNALLSRCTGTHIIFLHDHDVFATTLLEECVEFLARHESAGFVFSNMAWIDADGTNFQLMPACEPPLQAGRDLARSILTSGSFSSPVHACGMVRRAAYEKVGFQYDPKYGFLSDVDLWLRIAAHFDVGFINRPLITARRRDPSHTFAKINWKLFEWVIDIFRDNINRIFDPGSPDHEFAMKMLRRALRSDAWRNLFSAVVRGDREALECAPEAIKRGGGIGAYYAARIMLAAPALVSTGRGVYKLASLARLRHSAVERWQL